MTASPDEIRQWARDNGHELGDRGRIPTTIRDAYHSAHNGDAPAGPGPDYPDGMTDDDFLTDPGLPPGDDEEKQPRRPPRIKPSSPGGGWRSRFGREKGKSSNRKAKPKRPRVPVDEIISGGWRILARVAQPVPALQRTLKVQAPVAGLLLEDVVKDTFLDMMLQPLARAQRQGKAVAALAGPPMLVTAISLHAAQATAAGQMPNPIFMSVAQTALRESLMLWIDVAGPRFEEALKREREFEEHYGQDVDEFMAWLFAPPADPRDAAATAAEEDAVRRAQGILREE
jgi:hypothetical protein